VIVEKNAKIALLEKASCDSGPTQCLLCQGLIHELEACCAAKTRSEGKNTYLHTNLSWVSGREPRRLWPRSPQLMPKRPRPPTPILPLQRWRRQTRWANGLPLPGLRHTRGSQQSASRRTYVFSFKIMLLEIMSSRKAIASSTLLVRR
jgi:hypothetical protein